MPVELTERTLRDAVAVLAEWDGEGAGAAQAALEWMGWEGDGPLLLRRYDVQLFVWYTLPRKFLASLEDKRDAAAALGRTLERLGDRAASYAEVCRASETDQLLRLWESDDPDAMRRFRELLDRSGIEPPDTDLLAWGNVMGLDEARVREQVAIALEEAAEDGRLSPGAPGFRRRQARVADAALAEPWEGRDGCSRLQAVHAERFERWVVRGHARGSSRALGGHRSCLGHRCRRTARCASGRRTGGARTGAVAAAARQRRRRADANRRPQSGARARGG